MSVQRVTEGETFEARGPDRSRVEYTVAPSCGAKDGRWYCVTHGEVFANQLQKDSHIRDGDHRLAWLCFEHGPEVP